MADVITCFKFYRNRLRSFRSVRGQKWGFPIDFDCRPYNIQVSTTVLPVITPFCFQRWKSFQNRLTTDEVIAKSSTLRFFWNTVYKYVCVQGLLAIGEVKMNGCDMMEKWSACNSLSRHFMIIQNVSLNFFYNGKRQIVAGAAMTSGNLAPSTNVQIYTRCILYCV